MSQNDTTIDGNVGHGVAAEEGGARPVDSDGAVAASSGLSGGGGPRRRRVSTHLETVGAPDRGGDGVRSERARKLISVLEGVDGYPRLFREECEVEAGFFVQNFMERAGLRRGNLQREGISSSRTSVQNVVSILKKGLIEKYVVDSNCEFVETVIGHIAGELQKWARICLTDDGSEFEDKYYGLDSARDTEEEVRNLIRAFPQILSIKDEYGYCPIQYLLFVASQAGGNGLHQFNLKAISFIPLFAQQAIELGSFTAKQRGGLLVLAGLCNGHSVNLLQLLVVSEGKDKPGMTIERNELIDARLLEVLQRLASMNLLTKADIQKQNLLTALCTEQYFAAERFRFLSEWDPRALTKGDRDGHLPLHLASYDLRRDFCTVLKAGVDLLPGGEGLCLLFRKSKSGETPFELACDQHGSEEVTKAIESVLFRRDSSLTADASNALLLAATDSNISLDGVYFVLRRIGLERISLSPTAALDGAEGEGAKDRVDATPTRILRSSKKKRSAPAVRRSNRNRKLKRS